MKKPLIVSNIDPDTDDVIYCNDVGCWNVSRALRDCAAGKHGGWTLDIAEAYEGNKAVQVDEAKVERFRAMPDVLRKPLLGVVENGAVWLIDGHHRLRALYRNGAVRFHVMIIEEKDARPYQVFYNGKRKPPFKPY